MIPVTAHMRRTSNQLASRFIEPKTTALPEPHLERGAGFLRRLSLSNAPFAKVSLSWSSRLWPPYWLIAIRPMTPLPVHHQIQQFKQRHPILRLLISPSAQQPSVLIMDVPAVLHHLWVKGYSRAILMASNRLRFCHSLTYVSRYSLTLFSISMLAVHSMPSIVVIFCLFMVGWIHLLVFISRHSLTRQDCLQYRRESLSLRYLFDDASNSGIFGRCLDYHYGVMLVFSPISCVICKLAELTFCTKYFIVKRIKCITISSCVMNDRRWAWAVWQIQFSFWQSLLLPIVSMG